MVFSGKDSPNLSPLCLQYTALPVRLYICRQNGRRDGGGKGGGGRLSILRVIYSLCYLHQCETSVVQNSDIAAGSICSTLV